MFCCCCLKHVLLRVGFAVCSYVVVLLLRVVVRLNFCCWCVRVLFAFQLRCVVLVCCCFFFDCGLLLVLRLFVVCVFVV